MLESFTLNTFFLTTNSFKFDNNVKGVFNIGTIFFVDLVMEYKVCHREVDLVVDGVEVCPRKDNFDMEGIDTL